MKLTRKKRAKVDKLPNEILYLVLEQLFLDDDGYHDLLAASRVCRRFYLAATPWVYRHIKLDFRRRSHARLLSRLAQPGTKLPRHVRLLDIGHNNKATLAQQTEMVQFFLGLTNLVEVSWLDISVVPLALINVIAERLPRAEIMLNMNEVGTEPERDSPVPLFGGRTFHPAMSQLTFLNLDDMSPPADYTTFKTHLVHLIVRSPGLEHLIFRNRKYVEPLPYPNMSSIMQMHGLPQLRTLKIMTHRPVLTPEELVCWGTKGGWDKLETLYLYSDTDLEHFIALVPTLNDLLVETLAGGGNAVDFDDYFPEQLDAPLGPVTNLTYTPPVYRDKIPWAILERISGTITHLDISHWCFERGSPPFQPPTTEDIRKLRHLCPQLEILVMDISFDYGQIDPEMLSEWAQWENGLTLKLYAHVPDTDEDQLKKLDWWKMHQDWKRIVNIRREKNLPITNKLSLSFTRVRPWADMQTNNYDLELLFWKENDEENTNMEDWRGYSGSTDCTLEQQNIYETMCDDMLVRLRNKYFWDCASRLGILRVNNKPTKGGKSYPLYEGVRKQRERNKYNKRAIKVYGTDATLFDQWTQE